MVSPAGGDRSPRGDGPSHPRDPRSGTPGAFGTPMSIRSLLSAADGSDRELDLREKPVGRIPDDQLLWIDVSGDEERDLEILRDALGLDETVLEALRADLRLPDASVLGDGVHQLTLLWLDDEGIDEPVPIQVVAGDGWVITRHGRPLDRLDRQREKITDQREIGSLRPLEFVAAILDWHLDGFFEVAEHLERAVEHLDEEALGTDRDLLGRLVAMRQRIARARRIASLHTDIYAEIARPDFLAHLEDADNLLLSQATQRLERAIAAIANGREMLIGTFDVYMTRTAQRTNDIVRVLTWTSVILLPAVVLAGIMGMNFKVEIFEQTQLFWGVIGFMIATAVVTLLIARWRGWL
jgi:Mg2+ and Co2+ transporter CorA